MAAVYQVELERDERGWWVASVPAVPGAHTQGRSIAQAMNRTREALSLWVDNARSAELRPIIHLPATARASVRRALGARERLEQVEEEAAGVLRDAVRELTEEQKLSTRDVATLLELSSSRVDQLKRRRTDRTGSGRPAASSVARNQRATRAASARGSSGDKKRR